MWLFGREMWLFGREMWLSWPGDVALSCNPSYLGGQSSGMVRCGKPSSGQQMDILGRIKIFFSVMETGCALMSK
jgi:hypothetical protein